MKSWRGRAMAMVSRRKEIEIADCVHYCGYRYGRNEMNPYENYAQSLAAGKPIDDVQSDFVDFLRRYRPLSLGQALGIETSQAYPLWSLPWRTTEQIKQRPGWTATPGEIVDIMAYFNAEGIPRSALEREFDWHERAFATMRDAGYRPERFGFITVREFRDESRSCYLVLDGNHRLSALSALGHRSVVARQARGTTVDRANVARWPLVRTGLMPVADALLVFDAYLAGNLEPMQVDAPCAVL